MIANRIELILAELQEGTGAAFAGTVRHVGLRRSLKVWFADLDERHGPVAELLPYGLRGHQVKLGFGNFAAAVVGQMQKASDEDIQLARALVASISTETVLEIPGQNPAEWLIKDGSFRISATLRNLNDPNSDQALATTCRELIVPLMAAMAELIGYDVIDTSVEVREDIFEGSVLQSVIRRRERNPRNRLLCIRIHGERCAVCGMEPRARYGIAGGVIEVHHRQPLSTLGAPRAYDPKEDLVPLCPTCHRAAHTRSPMPYSPKQLRDLIGAAGD